MTTKELTPAKPGLPPAKTPAARSPFDYLQREIDQLFDSFNRWPAAFQPSGFSPSMQVIETDSAIEITTELPGIDEKDIDISIANDTLTIRGEKKVDKDEKTKNYRLVERSYGAFERSVALPPGTDGARIKAKLTQGVLKVEVPKPAAAKAQKVSIATD